MSKKLEQFKRKKEYLVCVDSDGCAVDSMDVKHIRCFGPSMVELWGLGKWETPILRRWNQDNLYSVTRGMNRFTGLAKALKEIDREYCPIAGLHRFEQWVEDSGELSNEALLEAIHKGGECAENICMEKALAWSELVNQRIAGLSPEEIKPFQGVKEALQAAQAVADVAVVSSANPEAVEAEWKRFGLASAVDILLAQDTGTKAYCIQELLKKGYRKNKAVMVGDAMGDYEAAGKNGVFFYPILVKEEEASWEEFRETALVRLAEGSFGGDYEMQIRKRFINNLK